MVLCQPPALSEHLGGKQKPKKKEKMYKAENWCLQTAMVKDRLQLKALKARGKEIKMSFCLKKTARKSAFVLKKLRAARLQRSVWCEVLLPRALQGLLEHQEQFPSSLWVFIMLQCSKRTGFPQCFLLFGRLCHGNLERLHVRDSGLSCKAPTLRNP